VFSQDIRTAFPDLTLTTVAIERNDGRYRPGARLTLAQPELLDDWPKSRENVFVKNKEVRNSKNIFVFDKNLGCCGSSQ
jgi:hypothetical protein